MPQLNFANIGFIVIIVAMSTSPAFALGNGNLNLLLVGIMALSPFAIIKYPEIDYKAIFFLVFITLIISFPLLNHPETMRWSTIIFTILFCLTFVAYSSLLKHTDIGAEQYLKIIKYLIYAYAIVLLIQQFCVLTGLPIFNLSNYDKATPWKLNALTSEPSHSARIMGILMYCFLYVKELKNEKAYSLKEDLKEDKWVWIGFLWTMLTMVSASAFVFIGIVMLKFFKLRYTPYLLGIITAIIITVSFIEIKPLQRTTDIFLATITLDEDVIMKTDGSAAARIVPTIKLIKTVTIFSADGLFGHGIDQLSRNRVVDMSKVGYGNQGVTGGSMTMWYDYGFIVFALWIGFTLYCCFNKKDPFVSLVFWFFLVFLFGINNQIVWLALILMYTNKKIKLES